jgi:hypothetical protein
LHFDLGGARLRLGLTDPGLQPLERCAGGGPFTCGCATGEQSLKFRQPVPYVLLLAHAALPSSVMGGV